MGLRRLNQHETAALSVMCRARLQVALEPPSSVITALSRYLRTAGWLPGPADRRAAAFVRSWPGDAPTPPSV